VKVNRLGFYMWRTKEHGRLAVQIFDSIPGDIFEAVILKTVETVIVRRHELHELDPRKLYGGGDEA
jgi:hypothetical protein